MIIMRSLRKRFRTIVTLWFLLGSLLLLSSMYIGGYSLIFLFLTALVFAIYCISLKCPSCGKAVLHNPIKIFGVEVYIWTAWVPKKCTKCGERLE
jgi:hypothetical protein